MAASDMHLSVARTLKPIKSHSTTDLMKIGSFKVQLKDPVLGMTTIHYDLLGFGEALAAYKSFCERTQS